VGAAGADGDVETTAASDAGCGCRSAARAPNARIVILLAGLALLLQRRRRSADVTVRPVRR
jgi:MYXO-CTERM domain-containing protein